ncbi:hypothetical protein CAEBREN_08500 [Caenorhabditis brenneri]|uniref:Uncharacterized protein n=1 Tax=Caenorhabditis brenneri TaxID=135651 RepID=G0NI08_CAEBE|nr:hypothetical protein CAEBREN_08500 [Caenorhabditis brenneri]
MHPQIDELIGECLSLKKFAREELRRDITEEEKPSLKLALRRLKKLIKDLQALQKTFEDSSALVFRVHRRRQLNLEAFERKIEDQRKKIDGVVAIIMGGVLVNN